MKMVKIKTADLIGAQLDWAVAKAQGWRVHERNTGIWYSNEWPMAMVDDFKPSTYWNFGGPIIERETIEILPANAAPNCSSWKARHPTGGWSIESWGRTPLIAAMRAFVCSKLGDEVEVPEVTA